jgi:hypothetical protein
LSFPRKIEVSHSMEVDRWVAERHYLGNAPAISKLRLWVLDEKGERIGAMLWNKPSARMLDQKHILELTRMVMIDETEKNAESKALGMARKHIRKHFPEIKGLLAYSSTGQEHEGTIYQADNWFEMGRTSVSKKGWNTREGRDTKDFSEKVRWVRSP